MQNIPLFRWIKLGIASVVFLLWVIWVGNFWLLLLYPLIFDNYITKKIPWDFWKKTKDGKKPSAFIEWADALIFALLAVYMINIFLFQNYKIPTSSLEKSLLVGDHLFVSKVSFGPRMPNTPIAFPLVQNTFPITNSKSYTDWPHWDYKRLKGFGDVKRDDIVVFNFPAGDTVPFLSNNPSYFEQCLHKGLQGVYQDNSLLPEKPFASEWHRNSYLMSIGRKTIKSNPQNYGEVLDRPVDRRDNYVKRCVAIPGDVFEIRSNQIYINNEAVENPEDIQHVYRITTDGTVLNDRFYKRLGISNADRSGIPPNYSLPLTMAMVEKVKTMPFIKSIEIVDEKPSGQGLNVFPYSSDYDWSRDNFGPLKMPQAGETVDLNITNLVLYDRIIQNYEGNKLEVKGEQIFINGELSTTYTFKMNYYFMLGDNRHKSADSRYWGFVPEDHIVGKPILVWLSLDADRSFPANIRWNRFFKIVHN
ncbi:S26 family signal peptidase [Carboxylicivirga marina]|uniref:Signal peptidase I n=1 Tax=Carboxylicivirga marina TaxID=2800988 RepID=A0ABS1HPJ6_9BACT|nr:S26 family signal peptidase [Carboxylicivirga marina]MBK3519608.1 S26 family signal peptidase [Carboxylicivirga marina]